MDPDPDKVLNVDPDPVGQKVVDPGGSGSETLKKRFFFMYPHLLRLIKLPTSFNFNSLKQISILAKKIYFFMKGMLLDEILTLTYGSGQIII